MAQGCGASLVSKNILSGVIPTPPPPPLRRAAPPRSTAPPSPSSPPPPAQSVTAEVSAALRVRFFRTACPACWLLNVSRLIASRMVFRAQGESSASCARERGLNLVAPMLQHIVKKNILLINRSIALGSRRAGAGIGFGIPLTGEQLIRADAS